MSELILPRDFEYAPRLVLATDLETDEFLEGFMRLVAHADNQDVRDEYPQATKPYILDIETARAALERTKLLTEPGRRMPYFMFSGKYAVGMAMTANNIVDAPVGIDPSWPNLSSYICHPFRGLGLGRKAFEAQMRDVLEYFDGHAWSGAADTNAASVHGLEIAGFVRENVPAPEGYGIYTYDHVRDNGLILPSRFRG